MDDVQSNVFHPQNLIHIIDIKTSLSTQNHSSPDLLPTLSPPPHVTSTSGKSTPSNQEAEVCDEEEEAGGPRATGDEQAHDGHQSCPRVTRAWKLGNWWSRSRGLCHRLLFRGQASSQIDETGLWIDDFNL